MLEEPPLSNSSDHASQVGTEDMKDEISSLSERSYAGTLSAKRPTHCFQLSSSSLSSQERISNHVSGSTERNARETKNKEREHNESPPKGKKVSSSSSSENPSVHQTLGAALDSSGATASKKLMEGSARFPISSLDCRVSAQYSFENPSFSKPCTSQFMRITGPSSHGVRLQADNFRFSFSDSHLKKGKRIGTGVHEPVSKGLFQEPTGFDRCMGSGSIKPSFPPKPPRFRLHHSHGFRLLQNSSVVERSLRHYFRLPEPPSDVINAEKWFVQNQLLWLEREEREERRRLILRMRGMTPIPSTERVKQEETTGGIVLDGFLLLSASGCEDPEEVESVTLQASQLERAVREDLLYFQNLFFLDVSENMLLLEDLLFLGGLETLHLTYNQISSLLALHDVVQWQELHHKFILGECIPESKSRPSADTLKNLFSSVEKGLRRVEKEVQEKSGEQARDTTSFGILLPHLTALNLSFNRIPSLHISFLAYFPSLRQLDLSGNNLRFLPEDLSCLRLVSHLALESNNFSIFFSASSSPSSSAFPAYSGEARHLFQSLSTMPSLVEVNLNRNNIECVPPLTYRPSNCSCFYPALKVIGLTHNPIKTVDYLLPLTSLHLTLRRIVLSNTPLSMNPAECSRAQPNFDDTIGMLLREKIRVEAQKAGIGKTRKEVEKKPRGETHPQPGVSSQQLTEVVDDLWQKDSWSRLIPMSEEPREKTNKTNIDSSTHTASGKNPSAEKEKENKNHDNAYSDEADNSHIQWNQNDQDDRESETENHATDSFRGIGGENEEGKLLVRNAAVAAAAAATAARRAEADRGSGFTEERSSSGTGFTCSHERHHTQCFAESKKIHEHGDLFRGSVPSSADFVNLLNMYLTDANSRKDRKWSSFLRSRQAHQSEREWSLKGLPKGREYEQSAACPSCTENIITPCNVIEYVHGYRVELVLKEDALKKKSTGDFLAERRGADPHDCPLITIPRYEEFMNIYQLAGGKRARWKKQQARAKTKGLRPAASLILVKPSSSSLSLTPTGESSELPVQELQENSARKVTWNSEQDGKKKLFPTPGSSHQPLQADTHHSLPYTDDDRVFLTTMGRDYEELEALREEKQKVNETSQASDYSHLRKTSEYDSSSPSNGIPFDSKNPTVGPSSSFDACKVPESSLPSIQSVIPTNVHGAMKELRALLRKPLPSLPYSSSRFLFKKK